MDIPPTNQVCHVGRAAVAGAAAACTKRWQAPVRCTGWQQHLLVCRISLCTVCQQDSSTYLLPECCCQQPHSRSSLAVPIAVAVWCPWFVCLPPGSQASSWFSHEAVAVRPG
jgi:hypothetical protein